jgi:hypothetical protein
MGRWIRDQMIEQEGDQSDFYRLAPYGALVGRPIAELGSIGRVDGATATLDSADAYRDVRPGSGLLPAMLRANLSGVDGGSIAVALNGTIAGVGPTFREADQLETAALLNPTFFRKGANTVALYRVSGDPGSPLLQAVATDSSR